MKQRIFKYDIGLMFIKDFNDFIEQCNKMGQDGWELVQWREITIPDINSKIQFTLNDIRMNIVATWKIEVSNED